MKANALFTIFLLVAITALFNLQCSNKDESSSSCALTNCINGGTCLNGNCNCPTWYEGDNCGQEVRAKFLGTYKGTINAYDYLHPNGLNGAVTTAFSTHPEGPQYISMDGSYMKIQLTSPSGTFDIPTQSVGSSTWSGSGSFSGNSVHLEFGGYDNLGHAESFIINAQRQ